MGFEKNMGWRYIFGCDGWFVRRNRHLWANFGCLRILRCRAQYSCCLQRYGDCGGLDERCLVHQHGWRTLPSRFFWNRISAWGFGLCARLDGGLLSCCTLCGTLPQKAGFIHRPRLFWVSFWRPLAPDDCRSFRGALFFYLCCSADIWGGTNYIPFNWCSVRNRYFAGAWRG